jgi:hypothetical protein
MLLGAKMKFYVLRLVVSDITKHVSLFLSADVRRSSFSHAIHVRL